MKLTVRHSTRYRYRQPVALQPHRILAMPRGGAELHVIDFALDAGPDATIAWSDDVFGNRIATAAFSGTMTELAIVAVMTVALDASPWPVFPIAVEAHRYPFRYSAEDRIDLGALAEGDPADGGDVADFARSFVASEPTDTLALLKDLTAGMLPRVAYRQRSEEGTQPAAETLAIGGGSCRDIATLFIACARHLGFGSRAVSGYIHDPDAPSGEPGSTHAWAEVYLPGAGWIACDPTHGRVGDAFLVPVAVAREIAHILPLTGSYAGPADALIDMSVNVVVTALAEDAANQIPITCEGNPK